MSPGVVQGKDPVGVQGGEAPWTLKAFSIYEIDNHASMHLTHEDLNTHHKGL